jgi:hypothetical protein
VAGRDLIPQARLALPVPARRSAGGRRHWEAPFCVRSALPWLLSRCRFLPQARLAIDSGALHSVDTWRRLIPQAPLTGDTGRPLYKSKSAHGEIAGALAAISADYLQDKSTTRYDELQAKSCEKNRRSSPAMRR